MIETFLKKEKRKGRRKGENKETEMSLVCEKGKVEDKTKGGTSWPPKITIRQAFHVAVRIKVTMLPYLAGSASLRSQFHHNSCFLSSVP